MSIYGYKGDLYSAFIEDSNGQVRWYEFHLTWKLAHDALCRQLDEMAENFQVLSNRVEMEGKNV